VGHGIDCEPPSSAKSTPHVGLCGLFYGEMYLYKQCNYAGISMYECHGFVK
jgi:hypothetical protein